MNKFQDLQSKRNAKLQQLNDTPSSSWKKELFKLELNLLDGKIAIAEFKEKNK
jgi:hypothetical protein